MSDAPSNHIADALKYAGDIQPMRIMVVAPSRYTALEKLQEGVAILEGFGHTVRLHPQVHLQHKGLAGTTEQRAAALQEAFLDPWTDVVMAAAGGSRAIYLLDHLDFEKIAKSSKPFPKPFIGYSDSTVLLPALYLRGRVPAYHGSSLNHVPKSDGLSLASWMKAVSGQPLSYAMPDSYMLDTGFSGESVTGQLWGGNLCLFQYLTGTDWLPLVKGSILFIEDIYEDIRNIDRMLWRLRNTGWLQTAKALVVGKFSEVTDGSGSGDTIQDLVLAHTQGLSIPVIMNAPFGHSERLLPMPLGRRATLTLQGDSAHLDIEGLRR